MGEVSEPPSRETGWSEPSDRAPSLPFEQRSALLDTVFVNAPAGIAFLDQSFRYLLINDVLCASHGLPASEHIGKTVEEVAPYLWKTLKPLLESVLQGQTVVNREIDERQLNYPEHARHWFASYYPIRVEGVVTGIGCVTTDVTAVKDAERALQLRTNLYAMLSGTNRAVSRASSAEELFREVCELAVSVGGFSFAWIGVARGDTIETAALAGIDNGYVSELHLTLDPASARSKGPIGQAFLTGTSYVLNDFFATSMTTPWHELARRAGFASTASFPIREAGSVVAVLAVYSTERDFFSEDIVATLNEITPTLSFALDYFVEERVRREDEAQLRMYHRALNAISQGIVITDATESDNPVVFASPSFVRLTHYPLDEILGRNCRFLQGPDTNQSDVERLRRAVVAREACTVEFLNYKRDGQPFWNNVSMSPVINDHGDLTHFVGVQTDVTARRELEQQLLQSQKLEALGTLAGGIAHDFNNMLLVIRGYSGVLTKRIEDDELNEIAQRIDVAVQRAADITRRLLMFSHSHVLRPEATDVNQTLEDTLTLLERIIGQDIELHTEFESSLPAVIVDRGQIEQAVLNLVANAREAMPQGGSLRVTTSLVEHPKPFDSRDGTFAEGDYVLLEVTDTGVGMDERTQSHVFEPFFTTKESGSGLGLTTIYGIMKQSGGHVTLRSDLNQGTTFSLYFPVLEQSTLRPHPPAIPVTTLEGTETIVVVEDVDEARWLLTEFLQELGYTVVPAANGLDALKVINEWTGGVDLLLTDVVMPQMSGRELATRLVAARPQLKVLFTSGIPTNELVQLAEFDGRSLFVPKPYLPEDVARALRLLLD